MDCTKSAFEYEVFGGDGAWFAVNKKYTAEEAIQIFLDQNPEHSEDKISPDTLESGVVHWGFGYDEDMEEIRNTWWLDLVATCPSKRYCPVWVFTLW